MVPLCKAGPSDKDDEEGGKQRSCDDEEGNHTELNRAKRSRIGDRRRSC